MATVKREILSGSSNGLPFDLGTSVTVVHTIETTVADYEEVWVWLSNITTATEIVTFQIGHDSNTDARIKVQVPAESTILAIPGWTFKGVAGPNVVKALAGNANAVNVTGYVNHIDAA